MFIFIFNLVVNLNIFFFNKILNLELIKCKLFSPLFRVRVRIIIYRTNFVNILLTTKKNYLLKL
jgi:hypothetical protein